MRIMFTSFPGFGHLHPVMALALAARAGGHEVRLATGPDLVDWVQRCGIDAYPVGLTEVAAAADADRRFAGPHRTAHMFVDVWVSRALPDVLDLTATWTPDLVVHEEEEYAGVLLAAIHRVPCVTQSWAAPARPARQRELAIELLSGIWRTYLQSRAPRRLGELYLDACPPAFQTPQLGGIDLETEIVAVRPSEFDGPPGTAPDWLARLARPAAYLTLGTVPVFSTPAQLQHLATALAPLFAAVIVTTGPNPVNSLGALPPNVHPAQYLPQSAVLPVVDVLVSHGGAGGAAGALLHGLAQLILPGFGQSQIAIGEAVEALGIGLRLSPDQRRDTDIARAAVTLRDDPSFADTARRIGEQLRHPPGPELVLAILEKRFLPGGGAQCGC